MSALAALCGAGVGLGLVLVIAGWRGIDLPRPTRRFERPKVERANLRLGLAAGAAVVVGAATGWPVGAVLAGLAGWGAPSLLGGGRRHQAAVGRIEAVAGWAEMLRDTMAGSAGLEQAIIATASLAPLPIRAEVATLAVRLEGERLAPALRAFADEVADPTCDLVVAALVLAAEHQAQRLGELLGSLAAAARDQATMRLRVEAGRARPAPRSRSSSVPPAPWWPDWRCSTGATSPPTTPRSANLCSSWSAECSPRRSSGWRA